MSQAIGPVVSKKESAGKYAQYLVVSGGVGVATILCREALGLLVPEQRGGWYAATVAGAYSFGIVLNYLSQSLFTFNKAGPRSSQAFVRFAIVALVSALMTMLASSSLLFVLLKWPLLAAYAPSLAFAFAALLVSPVSFYLTGKWVFRK